MKTVAVVSGGLDSVTLAYWLKKSMHELHLVSFDYGQKHLKELRYAEMCAEALHSPISIVDISSLGLILESALTSVNIEVPDGNYAENNMAVTIVPNRNAIFLAIAYGIAVSVEAQNVAIGVHGGDHPVYPDCSAAFLVAFHKMELIATGQPIKMLAPFVDVGKEYLVKLGNDLGVPFENTWSCYKGGQLHCGTCATCVERKNAFEKAGVEDPTEYAK